MPDNLLREMDKLLAMPPGDARNEAAFELTKRMIGPRAPWADDDPEVAARWLAARGAGIDRALAGAVEFEHSTRALYAMQHGRDAETFAELAAYMDEVDRRAR